jgi:hypothetical protein
MNAGTCWGKNTIDPSGQRVEKPRKATLTFFFRSKPADQVSAWCFSLNPLSAKGGLYFLERWQNCEKRLLASSLLDVRMAGHPH